MATDFNITMKQYNGTDYDTLYPETKGSQIITPVPIASGGTNSNTASGAMNNLITALSTITPANNDLIPFKDASGNTVGKATISSLASVLQSVGGYAKIQTGSYVGTGTYGSSNPCSLTFDFVPKFICILQKYYALRVKSNNSVAFGILLWETGVERFESGYNLSGSGSIEYTYTNLTGTTFTYYATGNGGKNFFNETGQTYNWIAFG